MSAPTPSPSLTAAPIAARPFRLALVQLGGVGHDKAANLAQARAKIAEAARGDGQGKVELVVLPEIFNSPYATNQFRNYAEEIGFTPGDKYDTQNSASETIRLLSAAAKEEEIWLIGGSLPELADGKIYNSSPVFNPAGELVALHRKVHLFDIDIPGGITFKESDTLTGGDRITLVDTGKPMPHFGKLGLGICYDIRFPELAAIAARHGAIAMIYPAAFNTTTGPLHWDLLLRARAVDNQLFTALCSPARATSGDGYKAYGFSGVADPMGKIVGQLGEGPGILFVDVDSGVVDQARKGIPVTVQRRFDVYKDVAA